MCEPLVALHCNVLVGMDLKFGDCGIRCSPDAQQHEVQCYRHTRQSTPNNPNVAQTYHNQFYDTVGLEDCNNPVGLTRATPNTGDR